MPSGLPREILRIWCILHYMRLFPITNILCTLFFAGFFFAGCNTKDPIQKPTYIHIDSFHFNSNPLASSAVNAMTKSHDITTVWVYYNGQSVGVFDLPVTFPVMASGNGTLTIEPGVDVNGLNDLLGVYPFYEPDTFSFAAQPGKIISHVGATRYYKNVVQTPIADFDDPGQTFAADSGDTGIVRVTDDSLVFENAGSGMIRFTHAGQASLDRTIKPFPIPTGAAFIELNYKCDIPFSVEIQSSLGVGITTTLANLGGLFPTAGKWRKVYFNVQDFAAQYTGSSYNLYIRAALPAEASSGTILLDNIQLLHY